MSLGETKWVFLWSVFTLTLVTRWSQEQKKNTMPKFMIQSKWQQCQQAGIMKNLSVEPCQYKLVLIVTLVDSNKISPEPEYVKVTNVEDNTTGEVLQLYNPLVLKIYLEEVTLIYPLRYLYSVNNKAYEVILQKDNTEEYSGCDNSTCGHSYHKGKLVLHSQGFCCHCNESTSRYHPRGGQDCKELKDHPDQGNHRCSSAHCLKFDPLWYSVNSLGQPRLHQGFSVQVFQQVDKADSNRRWSEITTGHPLHVSTEKTVDMAGNKVMVAYRELFSLSSLVVDNEHPLDRENKLLLVPQPHPNITKENLPPQLQTIEHSILLVNQTLIEREGTHCDRIGVSYTAFQKQTKRCAQPAQSCLNNQPMDLWLHDEEKRLSGQKGKYWLSNFASLANDPFVRNTTTGEQWLRFKHEGNHRVVVQMEINADRLNVVKGELLLQIVKVVIVNSKSSTTIKTDVFNRGIVSTRCSIKLVNCSLSKKTIKAATVGPRQLHSFHYSGKLTKHSEAKECQVVVVGHKHAVVAQRTIKMKKGSRCVCLANCQCKCMSESLVCEPLSEADYHMAGFTGPVPRRQHLYRQLPFGAKTTINTVLAVVIALLSLGILKAWVGIMVSRRVAAFGLCLFTRNVQKLNAYYEQELQEIAVEYNQFGEPVNPLTKKPVSKMSLTTELFLNMIFFLYLPFVWVHWLFIKCVSVQRRPAAGDKLPNSPDSDPSTGAESADRGPLSRQSLDRHFTLQQFRKQKVKLKKGLNCGILLENENNNNSADVCSNEGVFISTPRDQLDSRNIKRRRRAKKSSEKEDNTGKNLVDLYTLPGQLIYYNFTKAKMKPKNSGAKFSLCGTLEKFGEEYVFDVGDHNVQVVEVVKGKKKILHSLRLIDADYFKRTIKLTEVAKHISNRPLYPCLNIQDL